VLEQVAHGNEHSSLQVCSDVKKKPSTQYLQPAAEQEAQLSAHLIHDVPNK
jgi:hypothetical protein